MQSWGLVSLLSIISALLSYEDFRFKQVGLLESLVFVVLCFLYSSEDLFCFWPLCIFIFLDFLCRRLKKEKAFGAGDYFILLGSCFVVDSNSWPFFIALTGFFGISIFTILRRSSNSIPFIPSIVFATLLILVIRLLYL